MLPAVIASAQSDSLRASRSHHFCAPAMRTNRHGANSPSQLSQPSQRRSPRASAPVSPLSRAIAQNSSSAVEHAALSLNASMLAQPVAFQSSMPTRSSSNAGLEASAVVAEPVVVVGARDRNATNNPAPSKSEPSGTVTHLRPRAENTGRAAGRRSPTLP